jgi:hypothetical protein
MVYILIYFFYQIFTKSLVKIDKNDRHLPNFYRIYNENLLRELLTLFAMIYKWIYFYCQNWSRDLVKVGQKTGHLPKPKKLCGVCTLKVRADS